MKNIYSETHCHNSLHWWNTCKLLFELNDSVENTESLFFTSVILQTCNNITAAGPETFIHSMPLHKSSYHPDKEVSQTDNPRSNKGPRPPLWSVCVTEGNLNKAE